jgi:hypothetical protein
LTVTSVFLAGAHEYAAKAANIIAGMTLLRDLVFMIVINKNLLQINPEELLIISEYANNYSNNLNASLISAIASISCASVIMRGGAKRII